MKEVSDIKFKALRIRMLECEYTQAELAKAIGIAPSTLCSRLKGGTAVQLMGAGGNQQGT